VRLPGRRRRGKKKKKWPKCDLGKDRVIPLQAMRTIEVQDTALLSLNLGTMWMIGGLLDLTALLL